MGSMTLTVRNDHPLCGTWIADEEDSMAAYIIEAENGSFKVSGFCRPSGEDLEITELEWNGTSLSFMSRLSSPDSLMCCVFAMRGDGRADLAYTIYEVWLRERTPHHRQADSSDRPHDPTIKDGLETAVNDRLTVSPDHPLCGTWVADKEDPSVAFTVQSKEGTFSVSGVSRPDGEEFEITQLEWDGASLGFIARMPSTDTTTKNALSTRDDGRADLASTIYEIWKKKNVQRHDRPKGWDQPYD